MTPAECNYEIYDNELLAIVLLFEEWSKYLDAHPDPIMVYSYYKKLEYLMSTKLLNCRHSHSTQTLSQFEFIITTVLVSSMENLMH